MNKITPKQPRIHGSSVGPFYEELRRKIISTELAPGSDIDEKSLVEAFGVSRTPVREALIRFLWPLSKYKDKIASCTKEALVLFAFVDL